MVPREPSCFRGAQITLGNHTVKITKKSKNNFVDSRIRPCQSVEPVLAADYPSIRLGRYVRRVFSDILMSILRQRKPDSGPPRT